MSGKYQDFFSTEHLNSGMGARCARGGVYTLGGQTFSFVAQMGSTMVLARLLTPEDFGLIAMVSVFIRFLQMFSDMGLSTALIQAPTLNHKEASGFFWITLAICVILFFGLFASAPLVASFYKEPRLLRVVQVSACTFVFSGMGLQHLALLRRRMEYGRVAIVDYASSILSMIAALFSAWRGAGYWALVVMAITRPMFQTVLAWSLCRWRPGRIQHPSLIKERLRFAGFLAGHNFIQYFSRNADKIIIGRQVGADQLGGYAKAYQFILLPVTQLMMPLRGVVLPALCRLREDRDRLQDFFFLFVKLAVYVSVAMGVVAILFSEEIVAIILGKQWVETVPLFRIFSVGLWVSSLGFIGGWLLAAFGQSKKLFILACFTSPLSVLLYLLGSRWGAVGVASAVITAEVLFRGFMLFYSCFVCEVSLKRLLRCTLPAYILGAVILGISYMLLTNVQTVLWSKIGMVFLAGSAALIGALLFKPFRDDLRELIGNAKQLFARKK